MMIQKTFFVLAEFSPRMLKVGCMHVFADLPRFGTYSFTPMCRARIQAKQSINFGQHRSSSIAIVIFSTLQPLQQHNCRRRWLCRTGSQALSHLGRGKARRREARPAWLRDGTRVAKLACEPLESAPVDAMHASIETYGIEKWFTIIPSVTWNANSDKSFTIKRAGLPKHTLINYVMHSQSDSRSAIDTFCYSRRRQSHSLE